MLTENIHFHILVLDGVFSKDGDALRFYPFPWLDALDVGDVLATIEAYFRPVLARHGQRRRTRASRSIRQRRRRQCGPG